MAEIDPSPVPSQRAARHLISPRERLLHPSRRRNVYVQPASQTEIHTLHAMLGARLDHPIASAETACRIQEASPNSIWSIHGVKGLLGGVAFLPLNSLGLYEVIYGKMDFEQPPLETIAIRSQRPSIIYVWALVATRMGIVGLADVLRQLDIQRFRHVDIWAQTMTPQAERLAERLGLQRFDTSGGVFYKYGRSA